MGVNRSRRRFQSSSSAPEIHPTSATSKLREQPDVEIVPSTSDLFQRGTEFFSARPDKEWSLTDCISFVAMNERNITDALTSDHHFEQAGFRILLKD
jgi:uncharacterized protein